jgi:hypothetical protein
VDSIRTMTEFQFEPHDPQESERERRRPFAGAKADDRDRADLDETDGSADEPAVWLADGSGDEPDQEDDDDAADSDGKARDEEDEQASASTDDPQFGHAIEKLRASVLGGPRRIGSPGSKQALEDLIAPLRARFPQASDGTLFCVHKLQNDPDLTIPDFRSEAELYGLTLGGRSLHSAKVLLGLAKPSTRTPKARSEAAEEDAAPASPKRGVTTARSTGSGAGPNGQDLASRIADVVTRWQDEQTSDSGPLRDAIEEALAIIDEALEDDGDYDDA